MKSLKISLWVNLLFLQLLLASNEGYQKGLETLARGDSLKALLEFQNCLNTAHCGDSAYYYLALLHREVENNSKAYFGNLQKFKESGLSSTGLDWELAVYYQEQNHRETEKSLKAFLGDGEFQEKALAKLVQFYRRNAMADSLSKYREMEEKSMAGSSSLKREEKSLQKAIQDVEWSQIQVLANELLKHQSSHNLAHFALSLRDFEFGAWDEAYSHALKSGPEMAKNYAQYRPRFYALFQSGYWETLAREAGRFQKEMLAFPKEYYLLGEALVRSGDETKALEVFGELLTYPGWKFSDALSAARLFNKHGKFKEAKTLYLSVREGDLDKAAKEEFHFNLAKIYEKEDSLLKAVTEMEQILTTSLDKEHHRFYGEVCQKAGFFAKAKESLEFLLAMGVNKEELLNDLHVLYGKQGDKENLARVLEEKLKHFPGNAKTQMELAQVYLSLGKWEKAREQYAAVYSSHNQWEAGLEYAQLLFRDGEYQKALEIAEAVYGNVNENNRALNLILSLPEDVLDAKARKYYTQAKLRAEPNNLALRKRYVFLMEKLGHTEGEEYLEELRNIFRQAPSDTYTLRKIVDELRRKNRSEELSPYLETLASLDDEYQNLRELSENYYRQKKWEDFIELGRRAYQKRPNEKLARQFSIALINGGFSSRAVEFLGNHLKNFPYDDASHLALSVLLEEKNLELSLEHATAAFQLMPHQNSAWVFSKISLLSGWRKKQASDKLPYESYEYFPDSIHLLKGIEEFNLRNFSEAIKLFKRSTEKFETQSRNFIWKSMYALRDWRTISKECFVYNGLIKHPEFINYCGEAAWHLGQIEELDKLASKKYPGETASLLAFEGLAAFARGRYSKAAVLLSGIGENSPMYPEICWAYGKSLFHTKNYPEAHKHWQKNNKEIATRDSLYLMWGTSNLKIGNYEEAVHIFKKGLEKFPKDRDLLENLAFVYSKTGEKKQELNQRLAINRYFPLDESNNMALSKIWLTLNDPARALHVISPLDIGRNPVGLLIKGRAHLLLGDSPSAVECANLILTLDKNFKGAYWLLSEANKISGDLEASQAYFSKYSRLAGKD